MSECNSGIGIGDECPHTGSMWPGGGRSVPSWRGELVRCACVISSSQSGDGRDWADSRARHRRRGRTPPEPPSVERPHSGRQGCGRPNPTEAGSVLVEQRTFLHGFHVHPHRCCSSFQPEITLGIRSTPLEPAPPSLLGCLTLSPNGHVSIRK